MGLMSTIFTLAILGFGNTNTQAASYTKADVAKHNTASDCWVIINKNVYDLTSFANSHSGGEAAIIAVCGKDGTTSFNNGPHSTSSLNAISSSLLGALTTTPKPTTPSPTQTTPDPAFVLTSVVITPTTPILATGETLQVIVTSKDQDGVALTDTTTTFASSNDDVAKVNNKTGLVKGLRAGTTIITTTSVRGDKIITSYVVLTVTGETVVDNTPTTVDNQSINNDDSSENENDDSNESNHVEYKKQNYSNSSQNNNYKRESSEENDD